MIQKVNYIAIAFLTFISIFPNQKILADNSIQVSNNQVSTKIDSQNSYQINIDAWLSIIQHSQGKLSPQELALIKSAIANSYFQTGKYAAAVEYWRSAININESNQQTLLLANNLNNIAQAYLGLGQTLLAEKKLNEAIIIAKEEEQLNSILSSAYLALSNIEKIKGEYIRAETYSNDSLKYASGSEEKIAANHNLSQIFYLHSQKLAKKIEDISPQDLDIESLEEKITSYLDRALSAANKSIELSESENSQSLITVEAYLQLIKLSSQSKQFKSDYYLKKAETILAALPNSTRKVYALINLSEFKQNPVPSLKQATEIAEHLEDNRATSFGLGRLGQYYEQEKQYPEALDWTNKAILAASKTQTHKSLYQWHWQKGRIYNSLGQTDKSISAYDQAIASLQKIRTELARSPNEQLDFSQEIEPVYRELLQLLLSHPTSEQIDQALAIRDLLQLSELENFFGDDCLELISRTNKLLPQETGLIHTIILPEATHVIFKQGKQSTSIQIDITQSRLEKLVGQWRYSLENQVEETYFSLGKNMYNLLIKPIERELALNQPDTLIFMNDGILKNVPMAALHDGQQFLVENYAVNVSLSLNLRIRDERTFTPKAQVLAFGLSEETENFSALPHVKQEIRSINELITVKQFLNTEFIPTRVEKALIENNYPIVHFATHGKFDGTLEESFLETYQGRISLEDLENILNEHQLTFPDNPIDLLVLSACETASINNRATLGMAGIAIRAGVRNAVGSLWSVSDRSEVYLIKEFYDGLIREQLSPEESLRQAQMKMIGAEFHPSVWANLILISS